MLHTTRSLYILLTVMAIFKAILFVSSLMITTSLQFFFIKYKQSLLITLTVVDKIFYFSGSSVEQYKNHKSFNNLCHHQQDFNMDTEWIVFAANHGKSKCVL